MSNILILYIFKVALIIVLFYTAYRTLFRRIVFFQANRFYLLYTTLIAFIIPFLQFSWSPEDPIPVVPMIQQTIEPVRQYFVNQAISVDLINTESVTPELKNGWQWSWSVFLTITYLTGVFISLVLFMFKILKLRKIVIGSDREEHLGQTIFQVNGFSISSFFHYIFWHNAPDVKHRDWIIQHERVHMDQWHSLDNILLELVRIVQWFNPAAYFIARDLKLIHEYIADRAMIQQVDHISYGKLLIEQQALPHAPLGSTFHSFIKERLQMLSSHSSARWKLTFYLFTIPLLILSSLLFSSWVFKDSGVWEDRLNTEVLTGKTSSNLSSLEPLKLRWGKIHRNLPQIEGIREEVNRDKTLFLYYSLHEKIGKPRILESLDKDFIIYGQGKLPIKMEKVEIHINNGGLPDRIVSIELDDKQKFGDEIKRMISQNEKLIILFSGVLDQIPIDISFQILDFKNKAEYLKWGDMQFDIKRSGFNPIQVVDWKTMVSVVSQRHELIKGGQSNGGTRGTLMIKEGTSVVISPYTLAEKIKQDREIKDPIILQVIGDDGIQYSAIFDDEPHPKLHFQTWDEICYDLQIIDGAEIEVSESEWNLRWGPLEATRPPISFSHMRAGHYYYPFKTRYKGSADAEGPKTKEQLIEILVSAPHLSILGSKSFPEVEILLKHIKPQGLPNNYRFKYQKDKMTNPDDLQRLVTNLDSGDFLDIHDIRPVGNGKSISLYFKTR